LKGKPLLDTRIKAIMLAAGIAAAAVLTALFFARYEKQVSAFVPDCSLRTVFGINCVLCGGTRCAREIFRCNFAKALYYNPYAVVCMLAASVWYVMLVFSVFKKEYKPLRVSEKALWIVLASALLFWAVRNMEFYKSIFY